MKVLVLSKALVVGTYQRKLELIAQAPDVELVAVVPPVWKEPGVGSVPLERAHTRGYQLLSRPIALNGHFHLYFWPSLGRLLRQERPDVLHVDEESFNLATFQALFLGSRAGARGLFFNWANIDRRLPPPFSWMERYNLAHAAYAVAGNPAAAAILRRKGYTGPLAVIPQFGVDEAAFCPAPPSPLRSLLGTEGSLCIGYVGRLVPQKGLLDLFEAVAGMAGVWLLVAGRGEQEPALRLRATAPDLRGRVEFAGHVPSDRLPDLYRRMDVLVLPSRTTPRWKEQFGRVLIEAMACGVAVVGAASGEIPNVIGPAGLVYPEGDLPELRERLERLRDPALRAELGRQGRERVLAHYTQARIAQAYLDVYRTAAGSRSQRSSARPLPRAKAPNSSSTRPAAGMRRTR